MILRSFLFIPIILFAQHSNEISAILASKIQINNKIIKIDSIFKLWGLTGKTQKINNQSIEYIKWLYDKEKFDATINFVEPLIQEENSDSILYQEQLYFLGLSYYKKKDYDNSITAFNKTISLSKDNHLSSKAFSQLGKCYKKKGDYYKAIEYYKVGELLLKKNNDKKSLLINCINISQSYNNLFTENGHKKALKYFLTADSIAKNINVNDYYSYYIKIGIGQLYNTHKTLNINKATNYFNKALSIAKKNDDSLKIFNSLHHLGNLYNTTNPNKSLDYQKKAIKWISKNDSLNLFSIHMEKSYCHALKNEFKNSIKNYKKALNYLIDNEETLIKKNINNIDLLNVFSYSANAYFKSYKNSKNKLDLNNALKAYNKADRTFDLLIIESQGFQSKLFWRKQSSELYGKAIEACFAAGDVEKAFYFMEKNKALLLTKDLKNKQLKQSLNLPDSVINKEIELKKCIYNLEHLDTRHKNNDSITIALLSVENDLKNLHDNIQQKLINYKPINLKTNVISLNELQNNLDKNTAVLTYNISEYDDYSLITPENGYTPVIPDCKYGVKTFHPAYGILITKETVNFFKLKNTENLKSKVQELTSMMRTPFKTKKDNDTYNITSFDLFNTLLPSKALQDIIKHKKLRIIPDNYLNYIPFEAIITSKSDKAKYWIQENEISYAYSNSFLKSTNTKNNNTHNSFIGFAPINYDFLELNPLKNTLEEINLASDYFSGATYTHKKATKANFFRTLPKYNIIHLATHANAQDSISPWIAFTKNKLELEELALTTNQAKMVVLSGCNTLLGKQENGEGVMSLARAFFQSGAQSVVSSLWNVDDRSTTIIMGDFYKKLEGGQSKSSSLRASKVNYINNHNLSESSPYYWAPFVVLGNTKPLVNSSFFNWALFIFVLIMVGLLYVMIKLFFKKRKKYNQ